MKTGNIPKLYFIDNCAGKVVVSAGLPKKINFFTLTYPLIYHKSNTMIFLIYSIASLTPFIPFLI